MKFLFAETSDTIDPHFDFNRLRQGRARRVHTGDQYPHEHMASAPYDGLLVSRAAFSDHRASGKYSMAKTMRFRREGARRFLRYPESSHPDSMLMGDCGAFSYRDEDVPAYSVDDTLEFYADGRFTHGCSVDHLIFDFDPDNGPGNAEATRRQDITIELASEFVRLAPALGNGFTPVGVVQGWSPASMARAAKALVDMGYRSIALGGMARSDTREILQALEGINDAIGKGRHAVHVLGFGKIEEAALLRSAGVTSFDTTSPLLRAFKDDKRNYFLARGGSLEHYTAIRVPQATDERRSRNSAAARETGQEALLELEDQALGLLRAYAAGNGGIEQVLDAVMQYSKLVLADDRRSEQRNVERFDELRRSYARTLEARPWDACDCRVCTEIGVEALVFRSSNHNKRRGFHNLAAFHTYLTQQEQGE